MNLQQVNYNNTYSSQWVSRVEASLSRHTDTLVHRIFNSPFFWSTTFLTATIVFSAVALTASAAATSAVLFATVSGTTTCFIVYKHPHKIWFELSLLSVKVEAATTQFLKRWISKSITERHWFDQIHIPCSNNAKLFLGAIPLATMNHHQEICNLDHNRKGISILSVVQSFENNTSSAVGDPVRPIDWQHLHVKQKQVEIFDLQPIPTVQLHQGADFIHQSLSHEEMVYVHCKAGRGRSLLMILSYLLKYKLAEISTRPGENFVEKAIQTVRQCRPQINLNWRQKESLFQFAREVHAA